MLGIINTLKEKYDRLLSDGGDVSRRNFVKGIAGLAALTFISSSVPLEILEAKTLSLENQLKSYGVITGQTFYMTDTLYLENVSNLTIMDCKFIYPKGFSKHRVHIGKGCHHIIIESCIFDS